MNITLINPPSGLDYKTLPQTGDSPPLGLMNIASVLEKDGHRVNIIDASANRYEVDKTVKETLRENPDIIGITSMTTTYHIAKMIARRLKKVTNSPIVLGGLHATTMTKQCLDSGLFTYVIVGEGEISFPKLVNAIEKVKSKDIPGVNYCKKNKNIFNKEEFIKDLTKFPIRAWHLIDIKKYRPSPASYMKLPAVSTMISRGCPNGCIFCASKAIFGLTFRPHSERQIVDELTLLKEKGIKDINFWDVNFACDREYTIRVSKLIGKLGFVWNITTRCDSVDEKLLNIMANNGCYEIGYGIEAGTQETLDKINKNYTLDMIRKTVKATKKAGIHVKCYFSIGYPWQDKQDIRKAIEFAKELNPHIVTFSIIAPYPGSDLYKREAQKLINSDFIDMTHRSAKYTVSQHFDEEQLIKIMNKAYTEFYIRPRHIMESIKSIKSFMDIKRMVRSVRFVLNI